jgi:TerC family integral membrane protein
MRELCFRVPGRAKQPRRDRFSFKVSPHSVPELSQLSNILSLGLFAQVDVAPEPVIVGLWHWLAFAALVFVLLVLDLVVFHRDSREPTLRESATWTVVWCLIALAFNGLIWYWRGSTAAVEFLTGYLVEWTLSMDNVFVFAVIFSFFRVQLKYQYRVLFWGILGAVIMRLSFVLLGTALISRFDWIMPLFGVLLIYTGIKLIVQKESDFDPENNLLRRMAVKILPVASGDHGERFFVRQDGKFAITSLFLVLLVIESTDVVFAVDSVPAIFIITQDPFIVFTSNIFAILGLRALYFLLAGVMDLFRYLKYGLAAVLIFLGLKMVGEFVADHFFHHRGHLVSPLLSLLIIVILLAVAIVASVAAGPHQDEKQPSEKQPQDAGKN